MRSRRRVAPALVLLAIAGCSDGGSLAVQPCELPTLPPTFAAPAISRSQAQAALRDASTRMVLGLGSPGAAELGAALGQLSVHVGSGDREQACATLNLASQRLLSLPETPGGRPDRAAILMVLHLANRALRS